MVEFALVAPVMLLMLLGMIDLGRAFVFGVTSQEGARQAARLASTSNYDATVDDNAVLGRFIAAADPALAGCSRTSSSQTCNNGTWTLSINVIAADGSTYTSINAARVGNDLPAAKVTVTAQGQVALLPGFRSEAFGLAMPQIGVQGQTVMVIL